MEKGHRESAASLGNRVFATNRGHFGAKITTSGHFGAKATKKNSPEPECPGDQTRV